MCEPSKALEMQPLFCLLQRLSVTETSVGATLDGVKVERKVRRQRLRHLDQMQSQCGPSKESANQPIPSNIKFFNYLIVKEDMLKD